MSDTKIPAVPPDTVIGAFSLSDYKAKDASFGRAFIDKDEWRDKPVRHRYLHGGFDGNHTRFSFYLPPQEKYQARILQYLEGGSGGNETFLAIPNGLTLTWHEFAYEELGAMLIESNQGHFPLEGTGFHNDLYLFGASAETARFAKWLSGKLFGAETHHTYVFGGSGGGHRSIQCIMRAPDVYHGAVPQVAGVNPGVFWSAFGNVVTMIDATKMRGVVDAMEPGGSGDPYVGLSSLEREALADALRLGCPRNAVNQLYPISPFPFTFYNVREQDPEYFENFWTKPGYQGADTPELFNSRLVNIKIEVQRMVGPDEAAKASLLFRLSASAGATPQTNAGIVVDYPDPAKLFMARVIVANGKAKGRELVVSDVSNGLLIPFGQVIPELFDGVEPGDEVQIDNRQWIAFTQYYKYAAEHTIPALSRPEQRTPTELARVAVDGVPVYPQTKTANYDLDQVVAFPGKMIYIGATADIYIWLTFITPMDRMLRDVLGPNADDQYRLWWVDNATHGAPLLATFSTPEHDPALWETRLVDRDSANAQALRDIVAWVEHGRAPPASDRYELSADNALLLPSTAAERRGIQPVVKAIANGQVRAEVRVGEPVKLEGFGEVPPGAGSVVEAAWDFESKNLWAHKAIVDGKQHSVRLTAEHAYDTPGTYFPSFRVGSHRDGKTGRFPVNNLTRVRVVVRA
jgi:hypothetical protein